jgi:hypothetical protein
LRVTIPGGNNQRFIIHPADVQTNGIYRQSFTVTANSAGAWRATATVSCVEQSAGYEPAQSSKP